MHHFSVVSCTSFLCFPFCSMFKWKYWILLLPCVDFRNHWAKVRWFYDCNLNCHTLAYFAGFFFHSPSIEWKINKWKWSRLNVQMFTFIQKILFSFIWQRYGEGSSFFLCEVIRDLMLNARFMWTHFWYLTHLRFIAVLIWRWPQKINYTHVFRFIVVYYKNRCKRV